MNMLTVADQETSICKLEYTLSLSINFLLRSRKTGHSCRDAVVPTNYVLSQIHEPQQILQDWSTLDRTEPV